MNPSVGQRPSEESVRVAPEALRGFYEDCFRKLGVPEDEAAIVADSLLDADLSGTDTHGCARLHIYAERIRAGGTKPGASIDVVRDDGSTLVLDGGDGLGQVIATRAMRLAIERAGQHGIAAVAVRRSNHLGALAYYSKMALPHRQIGFAITGVAPTLAPWGAAEALLGSNPWSVSIPARRFPAIVVDLANGVVTSSHTRGAADTGDPLPEGVALDSEGRPTQDGTAAIEGSILPIGGHKGYALTLVLEVLASVLPGAAYSYGITRAENPGTPKGIGHLMMAINIDRFAEFEEFVDRVDDLLEHLKQAHHGPHQPGARIPGENAHATVVDRSRNGVPLSGRIRQRASKVAESLGVTPPFDA